MVSEDGRQVSEVGRQSRSRKRKADRLALKREYNGKNRMLVKKYVGYKKIDNKYRQRTLVNPCNSQFCALSKIFFADIQRKSHLFSTGFLVDKTETQRNPKDVD